MRRRLVAFVTCAAVLTAGCASYEVTRAYGGRVAAERFIDEHAYRTFLEGAALEARGEFLGAREAFVRVVERDASSVEAFTHLALVECRLGRDPAASFAHAEALDPRYAPLARARAECARAAGREDVDAERLAFELEPDDVEGALSWAASLERRGDWRHAFELRRELVVREPGSLEAWRGLERSARAVGERSWAAHAAERRTALAARRGAPDDDGLAAVERAMAAGDITSLVSLRSSARLGAAELLALALLHGRARFAVEEARRVLAAEPDASDVRLLGALAADRAGLAAERFVWLTPSDLSATRLGVLGVAALEELLARHVPGLGASSVAPPAVEATPRERRLAERLRSMRVTPPETR